VSEAHCILEKECYALAGQCNFKKLLVSSMVRRRITIGSNRLRAAVMSFAYANATPVPSGLVLSRPSPSAVLAAHPRVIRTEPIEGETNGTMHQV